MKAVLLDQFGGPEQMHLGDADAPEPGEGQVRVRVAATSVNRPDIVQREGNYPPPKGESEILGLEVAGVIDALGQGVSGWNLGDRVMTLVGGGGYAEYALAYADHLLPVPDSMTDAEAACVCETYITAYLNVFRLGCLRDGGNVLLHGGGGGVNTAAIQLCRALTPAARIMVTASSGKIQRVRGLGAQLVIDYREQDFAEAVREFTERAGADVILDHIGAKYLAQNMKSLAVGGSLVIIGVMGGVKAELNLALMMVKRQRIIGSVLRSRPRAEKAEIISDFRRTVLPLLDRRAIVPLVHDVIPLAEVRRAHEIMEAGEHFGKIVLDVGLSG
jgi:putative PIG3 family NAD(P)H quinone oxidoreductase